MFNDIREWADETFGPCSPERTVERASEEFAELVTEVTGKQYWTGDAVLEAADVIITLARIPGVTEAVDFKMAINKNRKWEKKGDGTGYHIKG